jgi:hypothetical protein
MSGFDDSGHEAGLFTLSVRAKKRSRDLDLPFPPQETSSHLLKPGSRERLSAQHSLRYQTLESDQAIEQKCREITTWLRVLFSLAQFTLSFRSSAEADNSRIS